MQHRDAYTLAGGNKMQQTNLGKLTRCLMAVFVVLSSFALLACPGDDDDDEEFRNVAATVPVNADTVEIVQGQDIIFANGAPFNLTGAQQLTVRFNDGTPQTATIFRGATSSDANVFFASCNFVVTGPVGGLLPLGQLFPPPPSFPTCTFLITATGVEVGGDEVVGQLILVLINAAGTRFESLPFPVELRIEDDGNLVVNDVDTGIDTDVTGTTGTTGG